VSRVEGPSLLKHVDLLRPSRPSFAPSIMAVECCVVPQRVILRVLCVCVCVCVCGGRDSGGVNDSSVVCFNSSHWPTSTFLCCLSLTSPREYRCYKARGKGQGPRPKG
jgi:hypothetical protein